METVNNIPKKLHRNTKKAILGGVAAGLADYSGIDVVLWRIIFVILAFSGVGILAYILFWIITPKNPDPEAVSEPVVRDYRIIQQILGLLLIGIGGLWLIDNMDLYWVNMVMDYTEPYRFPVVLILIGSAILYYSLNKKSTPVATEDTEPRKLVRVKEGRMIAGVCTGLGRYFNVDPVLIRILFIILTLVSTGILLLVYVIMALSIPNEEVSE